jgi:hypothetical protein
MNQDSKKEQLFQIVYYSAGSRLMTSEELQHLLKDSRLYNEAKSVTGLLIYSDGCFMQWLEGPQAAVTELFRKIRMDPRHHSVTQLIGHETHQRSFTEWTMAFSSLQEASEEEQESFRSLSSLLDDDGPLSNAESVVKILTESFLRDNA